MRKVEISSDGLRLAGELYSPTSGGVLPAVCICHGIPAVPFNPGERGYAELAQRFAAEGFVTLIFNFRGAGRSEGNFDMLGWTKDLVHALALLRGLEAVDNSKTFLLGFSGGAAASLYVAATDRRVAGVVSCASPADFEGILKGSQLDECLAQWRQTGIVRDPEFPQDFASWAAGFREVAPVHLVRRIAPRPLLLIHGDADEVVPVSHAHALFEAARDPKQLVVIEGGAHRLRVDEHAMSIALEWLHLQSAAVGD
ncbi:MAG: alpha/beta fold hydrolase [Chloroflexi bacterium]|nr:alpha/beta fold hydrolase [Chloroflexota bacterium]